MTSKFIYLDTYIGWGRQSKEVLGWTS